RRFPGKFQTALLHDMAEEHSDIDRAIDGILGVFPFLDSENYPEYLDKSRKRYIAELLQYRMSSELNGQLKDDCFKILEKISDSGIERLLRSPALCESLRRCNDLYSVLDLVEREH